MNNNIKCVVMNISISEYSFYHYVFPERDVSFVLRFAGIEIFDLGCDAKNYSDCQIYMKTNMSVCFTCTPTDWGKKYISFTSSSAKTMPL